MNDCIHASKLWRFLHERDLLGKRLGLSLDLESRQGSSMMPGLLKQLVLDELNDHCWRGLVKSDVTEVLILR